MRSCDFTTGDLVPDRRRAAAIFWEHTGDGELPYRAQWRGRTFTIRVNDFPEQPLYTLLVARGRSSAARIHCSGGSGVWPWSDR